MKHVVLNIVIACIALVAGFTLRSSVANWTWEKKYRSLDVEYQNLKGLYKNCQVTLDNSAAEKARMGQELGSSRKQLEDMQKQTQGKKVETDWAQKYEAIVIEQQKLIQDVSILKQRIEEMQKQTQTNKSN